MSDLKKERVKILSDRMYIPEGRYTKHDLRQFIAEIEDDETVDDVLTGVVV